MQPASELSCESVAPNFLLVRFVGTPSEVQIAGYLTWMTQQMLSGTGAVTVMDAMQSHLSSPTFVRQQAEWLAKNRNLIRERSMGTALALGNPILRFMLSSILSITPSPAPLTAHDTMLQALTWAMEQLRAHGSHVPGAMVQMARDAERVSA